MQQDAEFSVRVSFLELYNEDIFDLLSATDDLTKLRLYEDSARKGSVIIQVSWERDESGRRISPGACQLISKMAWSLRVFYEKFLVGTKHLELAVE